MIWAASVPELLAVAVVLLLVAAEAGFRLGRRHRARSDDAGRTHLGALQAALLGLLALLLGFTFAMAVSRYDARKALVLEEANAIGTAHLRTGLLPPAQRDASASLLREYITARLEFYAAGTDPARLEAAGRVAARIEARLWALAEEAMAQDPRSVPAGLYVEALNAVIDVNEKRRAALDNHVPETVLALLFAVSAGALGFIAYSSGLAGRRQYASTGIFALLVVLVLAIILDMDRPRRGLLLVSQESMVRLKATIDRDSAQRKEGSRP